MRQERKVQYRRDSQAPASMNWYVRRPPRRRVWFRLGFLVGVATTMSIQAVLIYYLA